MKSLQRLLCLVLVATLLAPPQAFAADATDGGISLNLIKGANGVLGSTNQFFGAVGAGNTELAAMAAEMAKMNAQANGSATPQSAFDQIKVNLQNEMTKASNCVMKNTRTYEKYHAKHKEAGSIPAEKLTTAEPTCKNYGTLIDGINTTKAKMKDIHKKTLCITEMQAAVNLIAEKAKAPFNQLTQSATEVYQTHTKIIDAHKTIAEKIAKEVDGEGGYRARLVKLRQLSLDLNNVLNAKKGESKDGMKTGLVKQVDDIKNMRTNAGNEWYFNLMQDVESCFHSQPAPCFNNDISLPPVQCISAMIANNAANKGAGTRARAATDQGGLRNIGLSNYMKAQTVNLPSNIDMARPEEFLKFTKTRFDATLAGVLSTYGNHTFSSNVDKGQLRNFVNVSYNSCYEKSAANFKADLDSKGGRYYPKITAMMDAERETANDIKNWIDRAEGEMTDFRTSFHKVYNSELSQFKTDCTAEEDPYKSLDCLRVLSATLDSGIKGTRRAIKLSNGQPWVVKAGETQLTMQTLTMDGAGKPVLGTVPVNCSGFDDCINYMDRSRQQHEGAQQAQETDRTSFTQQHNAAVRASFDVVAGHFATMSEIVKNAVGGVNTDLANIGVKASIKTKDIEGEALVENEKTGLIDMPKSMKAALAGRSAYTDIEEPKDVTTAYNTLEADLSKKATEAAAMKSKCRVEDAEYKALEALMPKDCSNIRAVCDRDKVPKAARMLDPIFKKSKVKVEDNSPRSRAQSEYRSCVNEIKNDARTVSNSELDAYSRKMGYGSIWQGEKGKDRSIDEEAKANVMEEFRAQKDKEVKGEIRGECSEVILGELGAQAGAGRNTFFQDKNRAITAALGSVAEACAVEDPEAESVTDACEEFKKSVKGVTVPRDEDETNVRGESAAEPQKNPFDWNSGTAPAK